MNELKQKLLLRYLDKDLSASEKKAFEELLLVDSDLSNELAVYESIIQGIQVHERKLLKANLNNLAQSISPNEFEAYKPEEETPASKPFISKEAIIRLLVLLCFFGFIISMILIYIKKFPVKHPIIDKIHNQIIYYDTLNSIKTDTIFRNINGDYIQGDTILYRDSEIQDIKKNEGGGVFE